MRGLLVRPCVRVCVCVCVYTRAGTCRRVPGHARPCFPLEGAPGTPGIWPEGQTVRDHGVPGDGLNRLFPSETHFLTTVLSVS